MRLLRNIRNRRIGKWIHKAFYRQKRYPIVDLTSVPLSPLHVREQGYEIPYLLTVELTRCRWFGVPGHAYGPQSSHPFVLTLQQYQRQGFLCPSKSPLFRYYESWQPASMADFLGLNAEDGDVNDILKLTPPFAKAHEVLPWSSESWFEFLCAHKHARTSSDIIIYPNDNAPILHMSSRSRHCGPHSIDSTKRECRHLIKVYDLIRRQKYRVRSPINLEYFDQHIVGDILVRGGDIRIMIANGQHRASAASVLGYNEIPVLFGVSHNRGPFLINRDDCRQWPLVTKGLFTTAQAYAIFDRIFDGDRLDMST